MKRANACHDCLKTYEKNEAYIHAVDDDDDDVDDDVKNSKVRR